MLLLPAAGLKSTVPLNEPVVVTFPAAVMWIASPRSAPVPPSCRTQTRLPAALNAKDKDVGTAGTRQILSPNPGIEIGGPREESRRRDLHPRCRRRDRGFRRSPFRRIRAPTAYCPRCRVSRSGHRSIHCWSIRHRRSSTICEKLPPTITLSDPSTTTVVATSLLTPPPLRTQSRLPLESYLATNASFPPALVKVLTPAPRSKSTVPWNEPARYTLPDESTAMPLMTVVTGTTNLHSQTGIGELLQNSSHRLIAGDVFEVRWPPGRPGNRTGPVRPTASCELPKSTSLTDPLLRRIDERHRLSGPFVLNPNVIDIPAFVIDDEVRLEIELQSNPLSGKRRQVKRHRFETDRACRAWQAARWSDLRRPLESGPQSKPDSVLKK